MRYFGSVPMKISRMFMLGCLGAGIALLAACAISNTGELLVTIPSDLSIEELLEKMEKASDPNGFYRKANSYIMRQKVSYVQNGVPVIYNVEVMFKRPSMMKTTTYENGKPTSAVLYNGENAWNIKPQTGESEKISGKGLALVQTFTGISNPKNRLSDVFKKIDVSLVNAGKKLEYRLVCHAKDEGIAPYIIYVGKDDFLTKKLETTMYTPQGNYSYLSIIDKYALYNGVMIASESSVTTAGLRRNFFMVDYELNPEIPDSEFIVPTAWYNKAEEIEPNALLKKKN
ncbi:MAG: hypothetical protein A2X49_04715 [Lentisphaerae bacterium GWF2_52_8]|nr:MAG: hypothetical protein A2X49_04715 [Lentisphaerae bacterium GWF2_52_8]